MKTPWYSVAALALAASAAHASALFTVTDLGAIPGAPGLSSASARGVNVSGTVAAFSTSDDLSIQSAFTASNGAAKTLALPVGYTDAAATAIGSDGMTVGEVRNRDTGTLQAFAQSGTAAAVAPQVDGSVASLAYGGNSSALVGVWFSADGRFHAMSAIPGFGAADLDSAIGAVSRGEIRAYNASLTMAGAADGADGRFHALKRSNDGTVTPLETLAPATDGFAYAIDDAGDVVGECAGPNFSHAVVWPNGSTAPVDFGSLPGYPYAAARALNAKGWVVGDDADASYVNFHAFINAAGTPVDLNDLIDPAAGWTLEKAYGVNDAGLIVGQGTEGGQHRAFLLTPNFVMAAIRIAGGLTAASPGDIPFLDVAPPSGSVDLNDVTRLVRRASGLDF